MTSYEFEVAAKNAVIERCLRAHEEEYKISDISVVWHSYILGYQKAILIDNGFNTRLFEVTYNSERDEMYIDEYLKTYNNVVLEPDTKVHI